MIKKRAKGKITESVSQAYLLGPIKSKGRNRS